MKSMIALRLRVYTLAHHEPKQLAAIINVVAGQNQAVG